MAKFWPLLFWAAWYKMKMYADENLLAIPFFFYHISIPNFFMSFQLTSLKYSQSAPTKKQTHFY
jgi:hypothetical protein